jgi:hypothetical protein
MLSSPDPGQSPLRDPEFQATKAWLMALGAGGEWPLFSLISVREIEVEEALAKLDAGLHQPVHSSEIDALTPGH